MKKELKKIVMIGPVYPYKGGISHYTGFLCRALQQRYSVDMISYKMQYPKFLFKAEQKEYGNDEFAIPGTEFILHTANPFNIWRVGREIRRRRPDLVIFQWWHPYFTPCLWILQRALGRKIRTLFLCHNVFPHERFPLDRQLTRLALRKADTYIVQSKTDEADLKTIRPEAICQVTHHPIYDGFRLKNLSRAEARRELGISDDARMVLFFGFVRDYKGLKHLLEAMPQAGDQIERLTLWVVGSFGEDRENYLDQIRRLKIEDRIQLVEGYIPDQEVEKYFAACDIVGLPYESATQSGIVQMAYGFDRPVLVTRVGGLPEVVEDEHTGFVVEPQEPAAIAEALKRFFLEEKGAYMEEQVKLAKHRFSWEHMVDVIEELYQK